MPVSYDPFHYQIRWPEEEREHHEPGEGHDIKYEAIELKGLRYEKLEIKELRFSFEDRGGDGIVIPIITTATNMNMTNAGRCGG